jgi:hypothetical protein
VIDLKRRRRVSLGTVVTIMFENRDTMRTRSRRWPVPRSIFTDEGIQDELDIYNPIIPEPGQLCATVFIELTTDEQMREWLPKLVGIETLGRVPAARRPTVRCSVDPQHESQLTREHVTAAVHYVTSSSPRRRWRRSSMGSPCWPSTTRYLEAVELLPHTVAELRTDLQG